MKVNNTIIIYIIACVSGFLYTCNVPIKNNEAGLGAQEIEETNVIDSLKSDEAFIVNAYDKSMFIMKAASLTKDNSDNEQVKTLAQSLMIEHSKVCAKLSALANEKNVAIPDSLGSLMNQQYLKLSMLKGDFFNKEFINTVVADHDELISDFDRMAVNATDESIKNFAANILSTLRVHYDEALNLKTQVDQTSQK